MIRRIVEATLTIFLSLFLGALGLACCALYAPETLEVLQIGANHAKDDILAILTGLGTEAGVNVWVRFLVQDEQLVFIGFVIAMRIGLSVLFALLAGMVGMAFGRGT
ncbi:MAG: hypothetical protein AAF713_10025 [Pseudomonadota bacterium]